MNKKEISMKKGQKVRILRTNQVATIVECIRVDFGGMLESGAYSCTCFVI
jgi:hypothetical protein